jgi:hypothetical protein
VLRNFILCVHERKHIQQSLEVTSPRRRSSIDYRLRDPRFPTYKRVNETTPD